MKFKWAHDGVSSIRVQIRKVNDEKLYLRSAVGQESEDKNETNKKNATISFRNAIQEQCALSEGVPSPRGRLKKFSSPFGRESLDGDFERSIYKSGLIATIIRS
jgi:hypothetical protein